MFSRHPLITLLATGLIFFLGSFSLGYYWALPHPESGNDPSIDDDRQRGETDSRMEAAEAGSDTPQEQPDQLSPDDWEAFLEYEGERSRMLGVNREYPRVNLRQGPGTDHGVVATPSGGELLEILDVYEGWYRARTRDGTLGWINRSIVRELNVPEPLAQDFRDELPPMEKSIQQQIPEEFEELSRAKVLSDRVNLRGGPGEQFDILGRAYADQLLRLLARQGNWLYVRNHLDQNYWINTDHVNINPSHPETPTIKVEPGEDAIDIWPTPQPQFRPLKSLSDSVQVRILERKDDQWVLLAVEQDLFGWANTDELRQ